MGNPWSWGLTRSMRRLNSTLAVFQRGKAPCGCGVAVIAHRRPTPALATDVAETAGSSPFSGERCASEPRRRPETPQEVPQCLLGRKRQQRPPRQASGGHGFAPPRSRPTATAAFGRPAPPSLMASGTDTPAARDQSRAGGHIPRRTPPGRRRPTPSPRSTGVASGCRHRASVGLALPHVARMRQHHIHQ